MRDVRRRSLAWKSIAAVLALASVAAACGSSKKESSSSGTTAAGTATTAAAKPVRGGSISVGPGWNNTAGSCPTRNVRCRVHNQQPVRSAHEGELGGTAAPWLVLSATRRRRHSVDSPRDRALSSTTARRSTPRAVVEPTPARRFRSAPALAPLKEVRSSMTSPSRSP